jgi:hypothetical protein
VNPSVLILAEELTFLLNCYTALHQDARIGRVETITGRAEAAKLLETFRPDVIVIDSSATGSGGLAGLVDGFKMPYGARLVVTCGPNERARFGPEARSVGAVGLLNREVFSGNTVLKAAQMPGVTRPAQGTLGEALEAVRAAAV